MPAPERAPGNGHPMSGGLKGVVAPLILLALGCADGGGSPVRPPGAALAGTWIDSGDSAHRFVFRSDGTFRKVAGGDTADGTWQAANGILTLRCAGTYKPVISADSLHFEAVRRGCSRLADCVFTGVGGELEGTDWLDEFGLVLRFDPEGFYIWGNALEEGTWVREGEEIRIVSVDKPTYAIDGDVLRIRRHDESAGTTFRRG